MARPCETQSPIELLTARLRLRRWRQADREPFAALNADPAVMEHFPRPLTGAESDGLVDRIDDHFGRHGWVLWAIEVVEGRRFAGYVGLWPATFDAPFTPAGEVGWRLAQGHWGHGYATEAAIAAMADGFERLGLDEIVSFTSTTNLRSQRVMERLGMRRDPVDDFEHPAIPLEHPLRPHLLYRMSRAAWAAR